MPRKLNSTNLSPKPKASALRLVLYLPVGEEEERGALRINHLKSKKDFSPYWLANIYVNAKQYNSSKTVKDTTPDDFM